MGRDGGELPGAGGPWLTPLRLARLGDVDDPRISPDGTRVAWVARRARAASYRGDVWIARTEGDPDPRRLSRGGGSARVPRWSPDGGRLAWIRDRAAGARIEVHDVAAGTTEPIGADHAPVDEIAWSPDGRTLAFTGRLASPDARPAPLHVDVITQLAYKRDGGGVVRERAALHVVDVGSGAIRTLHRTAGDLEAPRWSPDGTRLAIRARHPGGYRSSVNVVDADAAGPGGPLAVAGTDRSRFRLFAWSPDASRLLLVGGPEVSFHPGLWLFDARSGDLSELSDDPCCEVVDDPVWIEPDRALLHGRERARSGLYELDLQTGEMARIAAVDDRLWSMSADRSASRLAQVRESSIRPPAIVLFDRSSGEWRDMGPRRARRAGIQPAERATARSDGLAIDFWVLRPPGLREGEKAPAVFVVHGGPHLDVGDEWDGGLRQALASHGFVVAWANPRGSTSYGRPFADAVIGDFGGGEYRDLLAVVDAVAKRDDVDAMRLGIAGHSHGGYMTAWAIGQSDRFRAAVCMSPVFDLASEWGMSDEGVGWGEILLGGTPGDRADLYRDRSPSTHAWRARTPTLILHGARDERCPIGQSELMFATLRSAGCDAELVRYPDADHDLWGSPPAVQDVTSRVLAWLDRWLLDVPARA